MSQTDYNRTTRRDAGQSHLDNESSEEIKHRIDRTRNAMDETIDELGDRLNPHALLDEAINFFRSPKAKSSAKQAGGMLGDFANNLGQQVRDNPIPALLVGTGLAWLAFSSRADDELDDDDLDEGFMDEAFIDEDEYLDELHPGVYVTGDIADDLGYAPVGAVQGSDEHRQSKHRDDSMAARAKRTAGAVGESASDAASSLGETISDAATATKDAVTGAASSIGSAFSSAGETAGGAAKRGYRGARRGMRSTYRSAARGSRQAGRSATAAYRTSIDEMSDVYDRASLRVREAHHDYPLGVGLGCLALGALAGLAIPRTRQEDEWLGESADRFREDAWQAGEEAFERGKEAVQETVETARQSAEKHGLTGDTLAERATHVVEKAAGSLSQAAKEEGLHPQQLKHDVQDVVKETSQKVKQQTGATTREGATRVDDTGNAPTAKEPSRQVESKPDKPGTNQ